jgi:iron(III) transport system substrate-binding protein
MLARLVRGSILAIALAAGLGGISAARAADPYQPDRSLVEAAKKEGHVLLYTTHIVDQIVRPLIKSFQTYVPGVDVKYVRADGLALAVRLTNEARANRVQSDVWCMVDSVGPVLQNGFAAEFEVPSANGLPPALVDPKHRWVATNLGVRSAAYNTQLVPKETAPRSYQDLLDPRWKGKIMFDESSLAEVAALYKRWGKDKAADYLDKLGRSGNLQIQRGRNVVAQLLAAGEAPLGVTIYAYEMEEFKQKKAPVEWGLLDVTPGLLQITSVGRRAPNPYSAALYYDFLLGPDGQKIFSDMNRVPANPHVKSPMPRMDEAIQDPRFVLDTPEATGAIGEESLKLLDEKILKVNFEKK